MLKSQNSQVYQPGVMVCHYNQTNCVFILEASVQPPPTLKKGEGVTVQRIPSGKGA